MSFSGKGQSGLQETGGFGLFVASDFAHIDGALFPDRQNEETACWHSEEPVARVCQSKPVVSR